MTEFPFADWLRLGVTGFGLSPAEVWDTDLADWWMLCAPAGRSPMTTSELSKLIQSYPDEAPQ